MPATNYPEFNAAVTELTDRVELLLTDVGKMQSVASVQVAVDKAAEASTSATAAASSATAANTSKVAAASSATTASTAATNAGNSATAADASKVAAASSATAADSSKTAAAGSATAAASSATAASSSSTKASQWADAAENTVVETGKYSAKHHAAKAAASATAADGSKTAAAGSATSASTSASTATTKATEAAASATSAANSATSASTAKLSAESARDQAVTAASALTGSLSELGSIDLSSGVYPAKPAIAAFWKVTVGGTAGGVTYGVGDTLVYSKSLDQFYKIDNTESVSSVNGATGAVAITPASISAQPTHGNLTALAGLVGAADKLPYFTGAGALSVATLTAKARGLLASTDEAAMRTFLGLGTAAPAALTASNSDSTPGRVLQVGDFGLGGTTIYYAGDLNLLNKTGFYRTIAGVTNIPPGGLDSCLVHSSSGDTHQQICTSYSSGVTWGRGGGGYAPNITWTPWTAAPGLGQTWQDVTSSRSFGVTYLNTTGRTITVDIAITASTTMSLVAFLDGAPHYSPPATAGLITSISFDVPPGGYYQAFVSGGTGHGPVWMELR